MSERTSYLLPMLDTIPANKRNPVHFIALLNRFLKALLLTEIL